MDLIGREDLRFLAEKQSEFCVSLFMPTHRAGAEIQQDSIRLKNLLREAEEKLTAGGLRGADARDLLAPAGELLKDNDFWRHQGDGLALYLAPGEFYLYRLPLVLNELAVVAERFHVKSLIPVISEDGKFFVLALSQNEVRLFHGSRFSVSDVRMKKVPESLAEALKYDDPERQLQLHTGTSSRSGERSAIFHGHGVGTDDSKNNILRYFQQINKGLHEILREEKAPLILAGVEYLFPIYREANTYKSLLDDGIAGNPEELSERDLHSRAWDLVAPHFLVKRQKAAARYIELAGTGRAASDIETVALAAYNKKVELLFVTQGVQQWGVFDRASNKVVLHPQAEPGDVDLVDFSAVHTFLNGGEVYAVKQDESPGGSVAAAIFRF
jgi:hypothetical protein